MSSNGINKSLSWFPIDDLSLHFFGFFGRTVGRTHGERSGKRKRHDDDDDDVHRNHDDGASTKQ